MQLRRDSDRREVTSDASTSEDARLLARVAEGDRRAFETLYRAYYPRLSRFIGAMLRRPHLVEEVLNDAMLVVWRRPGSFNGKSKVSTWILAIAYRRALKALSRVDDPVEDKDAEGRASLEPGPEQNLARLETRAALRGAIGGLSPQHRAVVDLTFQAV